MTDTEKKELQVKEKLEVDSSAEQTRSGLIFTPDVDIFETTTEIMLLADMPGVSAEDLTIDLRENVLTLTGVASAAQGENENQLALEYQTGRYYRQFTLSEIIDQDKIDAQIIDGVLRLSLPKVEKATPRKITVKAG